MKMLSVCLALGLLGSTPGMAQQYCSGSVAADAFYSTVQSSGSASQVQYYAQIRNTTSKPVLISAHFVPARGGTVFSNLLNTRKTLNGHSTEAFLLGVQKLANPGGKGKLEVQEMKAAFQLFCAAN